MAHSKIEITIDELESYPNVNSICPGWVKTDMGGSSAPRSPEQGTDTAIWLATEAPQSESGKFWRDRKVIDF